MIIKIFQSITKWEFQRDSGSNLNLYTTISTSSALKTTITQSFEQEYKNWINFRAYRMKHKKRFRVLKWRFKDSNRWEELSLEKIFALFQLCDWIESMKRNAGSQWITTIACSLLSVHQFWLFDWLCESDVWANTKRKQKTMFSYDGGETEEQCIERSRRHIADECLNGTDDEQQLNMSLSGGIMAARSLVGSRTNEKTLLLWWIHCLRFNCLKNRKIFSKSSLEWESSKKTWRSS